MNNHTRCEFCGKLFSNSHAGLALVTKEEGRTEKVVYQRCSNCNSLNIIKLEIEYILEGAYG